MVVIQGLAIRQLSQIWTGWMWWGPRQQRLMAFELLWMCSFRLHAAYSAVPWWTKMPNVFLLKFLVCIIKYHTHWEFSSSSLPCDIMSSIAQMPSHASHIYDFLQWSLHDELNTCIPFSVQKVILEIILWLKPKWRWWFRYWLRNINVTRSRRTNVIRT